MLEPLEHDLEFSPEAGECGVIDILAKILNRRGQQVPISLISAVLQAEDGTLLGAVESFRDLSELESNRMP